MHRAFIEECRRITRHRGYLAALTTLPLVSILFFTLYFSTINMESLPIVVTDLDNSNSSRTLIEMIRATAHTEVAYQTTDYIQSLQLIKRGKAYAVLTIPKGFEQQILRGECAVISLCNSGTNISANGFISKDIKTVAATFNGAIELQAGKSIAQIMPINIKQHLLFNPELEYSAYLAPCFMPMMIMIFTMLGTVMALAERKKSNLKLITARCLPTTLSMTLFALLMLIVLFRVLDIPLNGSSSTVVAATIMLIIVYQAMAALFVGIFRYRHIAISVGGGYCVLAFTFSGLTFPTMAMNGVLQLFSHLFPFTYYMQIMVDQALRGAPAADSMTDFGYMTLFTLLPTLIYRRL